jgi:hypothetical protein
VSKAEAAWAAVAPALSLLFCGAVGNVSVRRTERRSKRVHLKGMGAKERKGNKLCAASKSD